MNDTIKKVIFAVFFPLCLIWVIIAIPYLTPGPEPLEDPYPWYVLGTDTIKDLLWDPEWEMFRESPDWNQSYWIDDQAKLLNVFLEDPVKYESNISNIINTLNSVYNEGYFPRRFVRVNPIIMNNDTKNMTMQNGFLRLTGNLTDPYDPNHPLSLQYYEASGSLDFAYLSGQLFTVYPYVEGEQYNWITYDPIRVSADQCQNPGFDANDSKGAYPENDLLPWEFSYPQSWAYSQDPPFVCVYSTRFVNKDPSDHGRCVGLEADNEGSENYWKSNKFAVQSSYSYVFDFYYRGNYTSGTPFKVKLRWYNTTTGEITEWLTQQKVSNPDVETPSPADWFTSGGQWSTDQSYSPTHSLKINITSGNAEWRSAYFPVTGGWKYEVGCKTKGNITSGEWYLTIRWFENTDGTGFISEYNQGLSSSWPGWNTEGAYYYAPDNAQSADIMFRALSGNGTTYADDFVVNEYAHAPVIEFSSDASDWLLSQTNCNSPPNADEADIYISSDTDTVGKYYFDLFGLGSANVPNEHFTTPYDLPFTTDPYHSKYRSLNLYGAHDYAKQYLYKPVPVSRFHNLTYWVQVGSSTNFYVYVFYTDDTYSQISKSSSSTTDWECQNIDNSSLSSGKTIEAIMFHQQTPDVNVYIDDVSISYKPINAQYSCQMEEQKSPYNATRFYVGTLQNYQDDDVNLTIRFRFTWNDPYLTQIMEFQNLKNYTTEIYFHNAFDGLSTIISGTGNRKTAYSSVWIPEIGRRFPDPDEWITTLLYSDEVWKWSQEHDYFIVELKQIPEWSGCLGLTVKVPNWALNDISNTRNDDTTLWGDDTGKYLHYLTYSFLFQVSANTTQTLNTTINCFNGYDFTNPGVYAEYLMNLGNYRNLDLSMNFHIGMIDYTLAKYLQKKNIDPHNMAKGSWDYYRNVFSSHNNGSYLMTTGKMIEACMILYGKYGDVKYLNFAKDLGNYLCSLQITDPGSTYGTFPMPHNNVTYLDCQAVSIIGLRLIQSYNSSYASACEKGLEAIHYDYQPDGYKRIPVGYVGENVPDEKRIFVYANGSYIDDDFWTYKASYTARASMGQNQTMMMLALSRVWSRTVYNASGLWIYISESMPGQLIPGIPWDLNSETQPWGLVVWYEIARAQRGSMQYYYMFLEKHKAITYADLTIAHSNVTIYALNGAGTMSSFYLKGLDEEAIPQFPIKVDGSDIPGSVNLDTFLTASYDTYFWNKTAYLLMIKAFPKSGNSTNLYVSFSTQPPEMWMPIMPIVGTFGLFLVILGPIYGISEFKKGKFEGLLIAFLMLMIGLCLVIGWLWG